MAHGLHASAPLYLAPRLHAIPFEPTRWEEHPLPVYEALKHFPTSRKRLAAEIATSDAEHVKGHVDGRCALGRRVLRACALESGHKLVIEDRHLGIEDQRLSGKAAIAFASSPKRQVWSRPFRLRSCTRPSALYARSRQ